MHFSNVFEIQSDLYCKYRGMCTLLIIALKCGFKREPCLLSPIDIYSEKEGLKVNHVIITSIDI